MAVTTKNPAALSPEQAIADRLHSAAIHLLRLVWIQDLKTGIGPARLSALSVLVFAGAKSLKELAEAEHVRPPTMSRIVAALEKEGLVQRKLAAMDRRQIRLEPTEKGKRVLMAARSRRVTDLAERLRVLTQEEQKLLDQATGILRKLIENA